MAKQLQPTKRRGKGNRRLGAPPPAGRKHFERSVLDSSEQEYLYGLPLRTRASNVSHIRTKDGKRTVTQVGEWSENEARGAQILAIDAAKEVESEEGARSYARTKLEGQLRHYYKQRKSMTDDEREACVQKRLNAELTDEYVEEVRKMVLQVPIQSERLMLYVNLARVTQREILRYRWSVEKMEKYIGAFNQMLFGKASSRKGPATCGNAPSNSP